MEDLLEFEKERMRLYNDVPLYPEIRCILLNHLNETVFPTNSTTVLGINEKGDSLTLGNTRTTQPPPLLSM
jgi:hypothetical protein